MISWTSLSLSLSPSSFSSNAKQATVPSMEAAKRVSPSGDQQRSTTLWLKKVLAIITGLAFRDIHTVTILSWAPKAVQDATYLLPSSSFTRKRRGLNLAATTGPLWPT